EAGAVRFRPMLLTALAVVAGAAVMLFDPIFQGLAISLVAGEAASLLISRMAVPGLYSMAARARARAPRTDVVELPVVQRAAGWRSAGGRARFADRRRDVGRQAIQRSIQGRRARLGGRSGRLLLVARGAGADDAALGGGAEAVAGVEDAGA